MSQYLYFVFVFFKSFKHSTLKTHSFQQSESSFQYSSSNLPSSHTRIIMIVLEDFFLIPNIVFRLYGFELNDVIYGSMKKFHKRMTIAITVTGIAMTLFLLTSCIVSIVNNINSKEHFFNKTTFNMVIVGESYILHKIKV